MKNLRNMKINDIPRRNLNIFNNIFKFYIYIYLYYIYKFILHLF